MCPRCETRTMMVNYDERKCISCGYEDPLFRTADEKIRSSKIEQIKPFTIGRKNPGRPKTSSIGIELDNPDDQLEAFNEAIIKMYERGDSFTKIALDLGVSLVRIKAVIDEKENEKKQVEKQRIIDAGHAGFDKIQVNVRVHQ